MVTAILRSNTISAFVLSYLLSAAMLFTAVFMMSENSPSNDFLYAHWAFGWLKTSSWLLPYLCVLVISIAAFLSRLRTRETKQVFGNTNLFMVAFVSFIMVQPKAALSRLDLLVAMLVILGVYLLLFSTYKRDSVLSQTFHIGLFLGVASLFTGQSIFLLLSVAFAILILRTGNWKEWAVLSLGLLMTAVFIMMIVIWYESPFLAFQRVIQSAWLGSVSFGKLNAGQMALMPVVFVSLSGLLGSLTAGTVTERNLTLSNVGWLLGIVLMSLILGLGWQSGIILASFPLSIFVVRALESIKRWWLADLLLLALIAAPFLSILWPL